METKVEREYQRQEEPAEVGPGKQRGKQQLARLQLKLVVEKQVQQMGPVSSKTNEGPGKTTDTR